MQEIYYDCLEEVYYDALIVSDSATTLIYKDMAIKRGEELLLKYMGPEISESLGFSKLDAAEFEWRKKLIRQQTYIDELEEWLQEQQKRMRDSKNAPCMLKQVP